MNSVLRHGGGLLALVSLLAGGCAHQEADNAFTVRQIDASPRRDGVVRVKLTTSGDLAEADEAVLVSYVKIIAVRAATKRQRQIADQRARATYQKLNRTGQITRRKVRYLAVATEKSVGSNVGAVSKSVMLWDTYSQEIVGNNVYEVEAAPAVGTKARFETYSAEYVGAGL